MKPHAVASRKIESFLSLAQLSTPCRRRPSLGSVPSRPAHPISQQFISTFRVSLLDTKSYNLLNSLSKPSRYSLHCPFRTLPSLRQCQYSYKYSFQRGCDTAGCQVWSVGYSPGLLYVPLSPPASSPHCLGKSLVPDRKGTRLNSSHVD